MSHQNHPQFLLRIDEATGENSTQVDDDDDEVVNGHNDQSLMKIIV